MSLELTAGTVEISEWQLRMERAIKDLHVASGAIGKGGWHQMGAADWGRVGQKVRFEYGRLALFADQLAAGLKLNGAFQARAEMYGLAGVKTYESIVRRDDIRAGFDEERRIRNSSESCGDCIRYEGLGWQPAGALPDIGDKCACKSRCRCSWERRRSTDGATILFHRPGLVFERKRRGATMPAKFNKRRCSKRNRFAAFKGIETADLRFFKGAPTSDRTLFRAVGNLPASDEEAMAIINRALPPGASPLKREDVYIHYAEAANTNFVGDRYAWLSSSTLRNIADDAAAGRSFMNSHRTGGLSHPAELPFGRTFAGRWEKFNSGDGETSERALVGMYMVRGQAPTGRLGPTTDDLHSQIEGGVLTDVSVGLDGGEIVCDVCGADLARSECDHVPGMTWEMDDEAIEAQEARGVPRGRATYTIDGAGMAEVSAVYDGAVPGAGFRRAYTFSRSHPRLSRVARRELSEAYGRLGIEGDFRGRARIHEGFSMRFNLARLFRAAGLRPSEVDPDDLREAEKELNRQAARLGKAKKRPAAREGDPAPAPAKLHSSGLSIRERKLRRENKRLRLQQERLAAERNTDLANSIAERATEHSLSAVNAGRILPRGREDFARIWCLNALDDKGLGEKFSMSWTNKDGLKLSPVPTGSKPDHNRRELFERFAKNLPAHSLTGEFIPSEDDDAEELDPATASRDIFGNGQANGGLGMLALGNTRTAPDELASAADSARKHAEKRNAMNRRGRGDNDYVN